MNEIFRQFDDVIDDDAQVIYHPILGGWKAESFDALGEVSSVEYIYLNPSGGSDDGVPTVFLYQGPNGDPGQDEALVHVVVFEERTVSATSDRNV